MCSQAAQSLQPNEMLSTQNDATHYGFCFLPAHLNDTEKEAERNEES